MSARLLALALTLGVVLVLTAAAEPARARIATDVAHGDTLPLYASFRYGDQVRTRRRPMARKYHPVVGVHRVVTVPEFHERAASDAALAADGARRANAVAGARPDDDAPAAAHEDGADAFRLSATFHVGRMGARTPWIGVMQTGPAGDEYLEELQIFFDTLPSPEGHPTSSVTRMTFAAKYSPAFNNLTLEYVWREQRSYDPALAISVSGVLAIVCVSVLAVVMFSGRDALRRELVVKIRDE